jgi:predicted porin
MKFSRSIGRVGATTLGLLGCMSAAQAQSTGVQIYGTVDLAVGRLESQAPGAPNAPITRVNGVHSGGVQTSYFGIRGTEDLGDGLKAKFALEAFFRADTGTSGRFGPPGPPQDPYFSRASWVGLEGGFGEVRAGLNSNPAWLAMVFSSAMGSNSLFSPSFRQQYNGSTRASHGLDTGLPNSISYTTPTWGGLAGTLALQAAEGGVGTSNTIANLVYRAGPLLLTAGYASTGHEPPPEPAALQNQNWYLLGGSYDFKVVKLFGQYTDFKDDLAGLQIKTPHLGLTAPLGNGELQVAWARAKNSGSSTASRTTTSLGYIHNLSRRTSLYGILSSDKLPVGTATSTVVGMRHTF